MASTDQILPGFLAAQCLGQDVVGGHEAGLLATVLALMAIAFYDVLLGKRDLFALDLHIVFQADYRRCAVGQADGVYEFAVFILDRIYLAEYYQGDCSLEFQDSERFIVLVEEQYRKL